MKTTQLTREINKLQKLYNTLMNSYYKSCKYDDNHSFPIDANYELYHKAENISNMKQKLIDALKLIDEYNNDTNN